MIRKMIFLTHYFNILNVINSPHFINLYWQFCSMNIWSHRQPKKILGREFFRLTQASWLELKIKTAIKIYIHQWCCQLFLLSYISQFYSFMKWINNKEEENGASQGMSWLSVNFFPSTHKQNFFWNGWNDSRFSRIKLLAYFLIQVFFQ